MKEVVKKAQEIKVGQIWESCEDLDRGGGRRRIVSVVAWEMAVMEPIGYGGRSITVNTQRFLGRQGRKNGYRLVKDA